MCLEVNPRPLGSTRKHSIQFAVNVLHVYLDRESASLRSQHRLKSCMRMKTCTKMVTV